MKLRWKKLVAPWEFSAHSGLVVHGAEFPVDPSTHGVFVLQYESQYGWEDVEIEEKEG